MKLAMGLLIFCCPAGWAALPSFPVTSFHVTEGADPKPWTKIFEAVNIHSAADPQRATIQIVEGFGAGSASLGITKSDHKLTVRRIVDGRAPDVLIVWKAPVEIVAPLLPASFQVFAREAHTGTPVLAGEKTKTGIVLWVATDPGPSGFERYPYLLQALVDLGMRVPSQSTKLWAFFDSSYRIRADVDYLARRWRASGIGVLHVAAWHNMKPDPVQDEYLNALIAACHRHAILVYAWLELPHVSEQFWAQHPEWREQTAAGQDAALDWRKLMNLQNPDCHRAVAQLVGTLLERFDWDGVNLAELYFESLEGASNPARFTPLNADVRKEFTLVGGFDPVSLFDGQSPYFAAKNGAGLRKFLDFRAVLTARLQSDWLSEVRKAHARKPYLDTVLTHIDDRFDPAIRDELGADVKRILPAVRAGKATLLVEDPANLWDLGADRYQKLGNEYRALTANTEGLAVDINVVDRYQDVYPTKKQTGVELMQLVHEASRAFGHVAIYFENSIEKTDLPLLPAAAAPADISELNDGSVQVRTRSAVRLPWSGPASLDGQPWPLRDNESVLVPAGTHLLSATGTEPPIRIEEFTGDVQSVSVSKHDVTLSYDDRSRVLAQLPSGVDTIAVDGVPFWKASEHPEEQIVVLPSGQHIATFAR